MAGEGKMGGRVRRYAKVGTAVGGLAARVAGERFLGREMNRDAHAAELRAVLGGLKGPLMKLAQILSTIPNALPREYADQLAELQSNAPPMGWSFVKRRMAGELGAGWQKNFSTFAHQAEAAASLGQVHRATGPGDQDLACKLQYPDMGSVIEADLAQLKLAFAVYRRFDKAIDPSGVHAELSARLREELDYGREARHMKLYGRMLKGEPGVHVPKVIEDLSTDRLLAMTWLEGEPLLYFTDHELEARNQVARNMFRAWYVPFYRY
ncbi:MAG: AarF/UbiB family protein, partial [Rhodospirillales bacterium]|nr:AarF/UbiB family protein [Rhodospirillales bacterium]